MNIIVLAGGYSPERNVSLVSGSVITKALREKGHIVFLLDAYENIEVCADFEAVYKAYSKENYNYIISEEEPDLEALKKANGNGEALLGRNILEACKLADVVFIALHGAAGENGQLQAAFDTFGVKYTGSGYAGCLLSMDKTIAKELMTVYGVNTPQGEEIEIDNMSDDELYSILSSKKLPFVIKPINGGSSVGISIVKNKSDIQQAVKYAKKYENKVQIEEYIEGREFTVGILGGVALPVLEIIPKSGFFDYKNKYQADLTDEICPADISEELAKKMQTAALKAHKALRLGSYSRADFMVDKNKNIYCLEVNSLPGMTPASLLPKEAAEVGIQYADLCEKIVELAFGNK